MAYDDTTSLKLLVIPKWAYYPVGQDPNEGHNRESAVNRENFTAIKEASGSKGPQKYEAIIFTFTIQYC